MSIRQNDRERHRQDIIELVHLHRCDTATPMLDGLYQLQAIGLLELLDERWRITAEGRKRLLRSRSRTDRRKLEKKCGA